MGGVVVGEVSVLSKVALYREIWEDFCPHLIQTFLESINRGGRNYGGWEVIPVFHDLRPKGQREREEEKCQVRVREYFECDNPVRLSSLPLQGMKVQMTKTSYQSCNQSFMMTDICYEVL